MLKAVQMITDAKSKSTAGSEALRQPVRVDLHPNRPAYRGMMGPNDHIVSMQADPTFEEIEAAGGKVERNSMRRILFLRICLWSRGLYRVLRIMRLG